MIVFLNRQISLTAIAISLLSFFSLAGLFSHWFWLFDLTNYFRLQTALIAIFCTVLFFYKRKFKISLFCILLIIINFYYLFPLFQTPQVKATNEQHIRTLIVNVQEKHEAIDPLITLIDSQKPDIVLLTETNAEWLEEAMDIEAKYPSFYLEPRFAGGGIAIYSRFPLIQVETKSLFEASRPAIIGNFLVDETEIAFIAAHPYPPLSQRLWHARNDQFDYIAAHTSKQSRPTIVIGDLNSTSWSPLFKQFVHGAGLQDARTGFGIKPTWPTKFPFLFRVPLDHFLASEEILVQNLYLGPDLGSDHLPLIVDFSIDTQ